MTQMARKTERTLIGEDQANLDSVPIGGAESEMKIGEDHENATEGMERTMKNDTTAI